MRCQQHRPSKILQRKVFYTFSWQEKIVVFKGLIIFCKDIILFVWLPGNVGKADSSRGASLNNWRICRCLQMSSENAGLVLYCTANASLLTWHTTNFWKNTLQWWHCCRPLQARCFSNCKFNPKITVICKTSARLAIWIVVKGTYITELHS